MAYEQLVSVPGSAPKNYVPTTDGQGGYSWAPQQGGGGGGTTDHNQLTNRDAENQHPISAITGLEDALNNKQPKGNYLTQDDLSGAVDDALTQAKESGAFDGADGVGIQSVEQTTTSTEDGGINVVTVTMTDGKTYTFNVRNGSKGSTGKTAYQYAQDGGYTGTEAEFTAKMAEEMPTKLPNPNALTFSGAVTGSYDGSEALTVEIPNGGSSTITVTAEKAFAASVLELNHVADNQYVAQHDSVMFEALEDTTLSVGNDNLIGNAFSVPSISSLAATVIYSEIENGYELSYNDAYTGTKNFQNQRFGFYANIENGKTYTIAFKCTSSTVYVYGLSEADTSDGTTAPGTLLGTASTVDGKKMLTFTATNNYNRLRIPCVTMPCEITEVTLCEGEAPLEYGSGAESYALSAGEKVWLSGVRKLTCVGTGRFYESPLALTSLNGISTKDGSINSCATNKVWVNMGDSIWTFGASTGGIGTITDYMITLCGGTWHNIATGGTTMASRPGDYAGTYDALDFWKLADAIVAGDYTDAKAAAAELTSNFSNIDNIDWEAVNYITVAYGTNDIAFGAEIDNASDLFDTATICGALRYGIKTINSAYPNIRFKVLGVLYRNADSVPVTKIVECNNALKDAAAYVGAEFIGGYGINEGNRSTFLYDGTHPNGEGKQRIAETLARNIHDIWYS